MSSHSFNQSFLSITLTQGSTDSLHKSGIETVLHIEEKQIVEELNPGERARILRKLDWHLLPFVSLLYMLSFLWVCRTLALSSVASYFMLPSGTGPMLVSGGMCTHTFYSPPLPLAGNAKVAGMSKDLNLIGLRYNIAAAVFFVCGITCSLCSILTCLL